MTLNGHFTFNFQFSLLRTAFRRLGYIIIVELSAIFAEPQYSADRTFTVSFDPHKFAGEVTEVIQEIFYKFYRIFLV